MTNRIRGGFSTHDNYDPTKCPRQSCSPGPYHLKCGPWRVVDCCKRTPNIDVEECQQCGKQVEGTCHFDEDYS